MKKLSDFLLEKLHPSKYKDEESIGDKIYKELSNRIKLQKSKIDALEKKCKIIKTNDFYTYVSW